MKSKVLHRGKYLHFINDRGHEYVKRVNCTGIVVIVAATPKGEAVLVEQYRRAVKNRVIEWPAGLVSDLGKEETLLAAAKRELLEETGYKAARIRPLVSGPLSSGFSADTLSFFMATGLQRVGEGGGDEMESITVHHVPLKKIEAWLKKMENAGRLVDPKVYAGVYFLKQKMSSLRGGRRPTKQ